MNNYKTAQFLYFKFALFESFAGLQKLSLGVYDPNRFRGGNIPLISELSQFYGFESLPKLKVVTVDNEENYECSSDDADEAQEQQEFEETGYYQRYRYYQQSKDQNITVNQSLKSTESQQMEEQQMEVELLFLKEKIEEKLKHLKYDSEVFKELKSVLHDVTRLLHNI